MTYLRALKKARRQIASGFDHYICIALENVGGREYQHRVMNLLNGLDTYEGWMYHYHKKLWERMDRHDFRQGRLQWLAHLIKEENEREYERVSRWDRMGGLLMPPSAYGLKDYRGWEK